MSEHIRTAKTADDKAQCIAWASAVLDRGLPGGAVDIIIARHDPARSNPQNSKAHAMYADIHRDAVIVMPGRRVVLSIYGVDEVKALLVVWFANERSLEGRPLKKPPRTVTCPITGQNITVRPSTVDGFSKADTVEFIEWLYALGTNAGVKWSEKAMAEYDSYKEAHQ
jgi:hypothetical protein